MAILPITEKVILMAYQIKPLKGMKKEEPRAGERLARLLAKKGQIEGKTTDSMGVIVPVVGVSFLNGIMADSNGQQWLRQQVEGVQDLLIRRAIGAGKLAIFDDAIDVGACLRVMTSSLESTRFSAAAVKAWFDAHLRERLQQRLLEKNPAMQQSVVQKLADQFCDSFCSLTGKNPTMSNKTKEAIVKAMELLPEDHESAVAEELMERMNEASESNGIEGAL